MNRTSSIRRGVGRSLLLALFPAVAWACNVPVFRYALEHWDPSRYELVVFSRGPIGAEGRAALARLGKAGANLDVSVDDVSQVIPERHAILAPGAADDLPLMVLAHTDVRDPNASLVSVWRRPLDSKLLAITASSPARRQAAEQLIRGVSAVWIMVECGNPAQNKATADLLKQTFASVAAESSLTGKTDENLIKFSIPLRVDFSLLRVSRNDPAEQFLITLLMGLVPDSERSRDVPMVFPVFGRGRVLCGLAGEAISEPRIKEAIVFLLGDCSCEIKEQNPGMDLVTDTDWNRRVGKVEPQGRRSTAEDLSGMLPEYRETSETASVVPAPDPVPFVAPAPLPVPSVVPVPAPGSSGRLRHNLVIALGVVLGVVAAGTLVIMRRNRS